MSENRLTKIEQTLAIYGYEKYFSICKVKPKY